MPRKRLVMTGNVYFTYPDGIIKRCCTVDDVLGEKKVTFHMPKEERDKYQHEMEKGMSERMSRYYDDNGNYVGER